MIDVLKYKIICLLPLENTYPSEARYCRGWLSSPLFRHTFADIALTPD